MKVVNNIERILPLLKFKEGIFYYLQVLSRKKDNPGQGRDVQLYSRSITSIDSLMLCVEEIKSLCTVFNARCYISLWPRSIEKYTKQLGLAISERIVHDSYSHKVFRLFDSIALSDDIIVWKGILDNSRCMIDVDCLKTDQDFLNSLNDFLKGKVSVEAIIPSVSGVHYICNNFYPKNLGATKIDNGGNWTFDLQGRAVTICRDVNTILYSCTPEK